MVAGRPRAFAALAGPDTDRPGSYFLVYRWRSVRASGLSSVSFLTRDHSDLPVPVSRNRHINETVTFLQRSCCQRPRRRRLGGLDGQGGTKPSVRDIARRLEDRCGTRQTRHWNPERPTGARRYLYARVRPPAPRSPTRAP